MDSLARVSVDESVKELKSKIYCFRDQQVMLDFDLAALYDVEVKVLNQAVKRNIERFPTAFYFKLTNEEYCSLKSQIVTSKGKGGRRKAPSAFTEQGIAMLSAVLRSSVAVKVSIHIIKVFVDLRKNERAYTLLNHRIDTVEQKIMGHESKFEKVFDALEHTDVPKQGVFFEGQVFDAHTFTCELIRSARKSLILIDNYVDETVLTLLSKRTTGVAATILTKKISKQLELDLQKHKEQYPEIVVKQFSKSHDRFLIIDDNEVYHIGASLKDLGKNWFAFSKMDISALAMIQKLQVG